MKMILLAVFSGIFLLMGAACNAAEMELERAPVVKPVRPKYRSYRPLPKSSKRKAAKPVKPAPAILVPVSRGNDKVNDMIFEDVTRSWQPYSYP